MVEEGKRESKPCRDQPAQTVTQRDEPTRKLGADEPKIRLQLVGSKSLTSDGFDSVLANEPDFGTEPRFQH